MDAFFIYVVIVVLNQFISKNNGIFLKLYLPSAIIIMYADNI